jgi:hypothetical protein
VLGPLIFNVILSYCLSNFFVDPFFLKNQLGTRRYVDSNKFLICYSNDIVFKVTSYIEANFCINKLQTILSKFGVTLDLNKIKSYDLSISQVVRFDYLGYTFLINPNNQIIRSGLPKNYQELYNTNNHVFLKYISNSNFKKIKTTLKLAIFELKNKDLYSVIKNVNVILTNISIYYKFYGNAKRLNFLDNFVDRCF